MSNVVPFKQKTRKKIIARRPNDTGRILIYTGIRYVRDDADEDYGPARGAEAALGVGAAGRLQA